MPKKRSIKTSSPSDFEPKRKNPISLGSDSNIDNDLKSITIGGETTPLKISKDTVEISSSLFVDGQPVQTGESSAGASALNDLSDVTYSSGDLTITSLDTIISGDLTFDSSGDITLDAHGKNVYIAYNGTSIYDFDINNQALKIMDSGDTGDYFQIAVETHGATTITTVDDNATAAHLTIRPNGRLIMEMADMDSEDDSWAITNNDINMMSFKTEGGAENTLKIYEPNDNSDNFYIEVGANGATSIQTVDIAGANANLTINPDGQLRLYKPPRVKEQASADSDLAGYGQLWVKNDTPNNLYFTNDAGNDVQITNGSSLAGGGGSSNYYIGHAGRGRCQYNNWYGTNTAYGFAYYFWSTNTGSTSVPTSWGDDRHPNHIVPFAGTITGYTIIGNVSTADTMEFAICKGTGVTHGSAGNYTLSQVGATQSAGGTANIQYKWEQTGLSVSVAKDDVLMLFFRRTTNNDSSSVYSEFSYNIIIEAS